MKVFIATSLLSFIVLLYTTAFAVSTKYVCPVEAEYGAEDGSSLANCFDGPDDVWGTGAPTSGDTVIICGTHRIPSGGIGSFTIQVNMTYKLGTMADCGSVGKGKVYGSVRDDGSTGWTFDAVNNAYKKAYTGEVLLVARMTADENPWNATLLGNIVNGATATTLGNLDTDSFYWDTTDGGTLWLKSNPSGTVHEIGQGHNFITLYDVASITESTVMGADTACTALDTSESGFFFVNHNGFGTYYDSWAGRTWGNHTIKNVRMFGAWLGVLVGGAAGNSEVTNLTVQDSCLFGSKTEMIYVNRVAGGKLTVTRNIIGSSQLQANGFGCEFNSSACGDAIDYNPANAAEADGGYAVVTDNVVTNILGHCIISTGGGEWKRNRCTNVGNPDRTIDASLSLANNGTVHPIIVAGNIFDNSSGVRATSGARIGCPTANNFHTLTGNIFYLPAGSPWKGIDWGGCTTNFTITNNTFINGTYGIHSSSDVSLAGTSIINNVFTGQQFPIYMFNTTMGTFTAKNNDLWPAAGQANPFKFANTDYASKTALEAGQATWTNNLQVDPLLLSDGRTTGLSPLRRVGISGYPCADARGRACYPDSPDIGAYSCGEGCPASTRTTATTRSAASARTAATTRTAR